MSVWGYKRSMSTALLKMPKIRITKKLVEGLLLEALGEKVLPIFQFIQDQKNISEFVVAEKLKMDIHEVRQLLYKLHDLDLVTYIRKKDRKKGWYISYWTYHPERVRDLMVRMKKVKLDLLKARLKKEEDNVNAFFMCKNACLRIDFEKATEFGFKCPECGELLNPQDNAKTIDHIKGRIKEIETEIAKIG